MSSESANPSPTTELAKERTRAAADRTLLAWIRTALSLIGFGFGLNKARDMLATAGILHGTDPLHSVVVFSLSFVGLGLVSLIGAAIQHAISAHRIQKPAFHYRGFRPLAAIVIAALIIIGLYALATMVRSA